MNYRPDKNNAPLAPLHEIQGRLERVTFQNPENGFVIARVQEEGRGQQLTTVTGQLADIPVGAALTLTGQWVVDPRYGRQFNVSHYTIHKPETLKGLERYLGSGLIKGIGPKFAGRIVAKFGHETMTVLEREPERLGEIAGLGPKRLALIKTTWAAQQGVQQIMVFLQGHGISAAYAGKIYKTYGQAAMKVVQANPYRLAEDIWGIGFRVADRIALSLGIQSIDPRRSRAGLLFALKEAADNGHCFLAKEKLFSLTAQLLQAPAGLALPAAALAPELQGLVRDEKVVADQDDIYLAPLYYAEKSVAERLVAIAQAAPGRAAALPGLRAEPRLDWVGRQLNISLAGEQQDAIETMLRQNLAVITGGPGTGKSTILKGLILILEAAATAHKIKLVIKLAAPTGRAAKRLGEATGRAAKTIHRLLEFDPARAGFKRTADNPLQADLLIIDEASMMDVVLAKALLQAVPPGCSLLLVGDADQLPSVGPGNVLKDIISADRLAVVRLNRIFRQGPGSLISLNAALINQGKSLELLPAYEGEKDFYCILRQEPEEIEEEILSLCRGRLASRYGFDPLADIQVLTPMRKGLIGADHLNHRLQEVLNPGQIPIEGIPRRFFAGDKVMQIRNNYDKEVFNGDFGRVVGPGLKDRTLVVNFDGQAKIYDFSELHELVPAYAITIHKSQGSEFPCVIVPLHTTHYPLLQRNLLYTAVTRGKKLVVLVGSRKALGIALRNNCVQQRQTKLKDRLAALLQERA